jgi:hypothetical protein
MLTRPNFAEQVSARVRLDKDGLLWTCGTQGGMWRGTPMGVRQRHWPSCVPA